MMQAAIETLRALRGLSYELQNGVFDMLEAIDHGDETERAMAISSLHEVLFPGTPDEPVEPSDTADPVLPPALVQDIRYVVEQRGDDICWMDAYQRLGRWIGVTVTHDSLRALGKEQMLRNCDRFVESMCQGTGYDQVPWNEQVENILGRPNFACSGFATILREAGHEIPTRAENEQARVLWWMLNLYLRHGDGWADVAEVETKEARATIADRIRWREVNTLPGLDDHNRKQLVAAMRTCGLTRLPTPQGEPVHAGKDAICPDCGRTYIQHPLDWRVLGHGNMPYLNVLCNGTLVKL